MSDKLDDLLEGINDSYGTLLMEELLSRLEITVKDFNEEMKNLCDDLVSKEKERQQLLEMLKSGVGMPNITPPIPKVENTESDQNPFTDFMDSKVEIIKTNDHVADEVSQSLPNIEIKDEEDNDQDIPEWEKKLAKLNKK